MSESLILLTPLLVIRKLWTKKQNLENIKKIKKVEKVKGKNQWVVRRVRRNFQRRAVRKVKRPNRRAVNYRKNPKVASRNQKVVRNPKSPRNRKSRRSRKNPRNRLKSTFQILLKEINIISLKTFKGPKPK